MVRIFVAVAAFVAGPSIALAVPVIWEAQGSVEFSDLSAAFFAGSMPGLAGTQAGDALVLRITFDTDAPLIGQTTHPAGGATYSFDASSLVLALEVPGRGTHVFTIDESVPPATIPSLVGVIDDQVIGDLVRDGVQFQHNYLTESGPDPLEFQVIAAFFSEATDIVMGGVLPLAPDPRFSVGIERLITIIDPGVDGGNLFGTFSSLVRVPNSIPEPRPLGLLCLGLAGWWAARRGHATRAG